MRTIRVKNHLPKISVIIDDDRWTSDNDYDFWCSKIQEISMAVRHNALEFSVLLTNDKEIQNLNLRFRGKDHPTNVLSFYEYSPKDVACGKAKGFLGDIALSYETIVREANEGSLELLNHFSHLMVHSILHLLGFDHVNDRDAKIMEICEIAILKKLGIKNPYD